MDTCPEVYKEWIKPAPLIPYCLTYMAGLHVSRHVWDILYQLLFSVKE